MVMARDREAWNSQKLVVLAHLKAGCSITQDEARGQFGIMRLASRIDELRREGWNVETEMIPVGEGGARVARYSLGAEPRRTSRFLPVAAENIPDELKALPQWVVWQAVERNGRTTKPPRQIDGRAAKANDPSTWTTFEKARAARNGAKFSRLWEGDISGYPTASEADVALLAMLLFWTDGDEDRARLLFEQSGLCREKWTGRVDYRRACFEFLRRKGATAEFSPPRKLHTRIGTVGGKTYIYRNA